MSPRGDQQKRGQDVGGPQGMCWVIDADVAAYFDTIPHDRLMKAVAERVVDGSMLALVKAFLEAPIVDERDGGRPRRNAQGTPQGGPWGTRISGDEGSSTSTSGIGRASASVMSCGGRPDERGSAWSSRSRS